MKYHLLIPAILVCLTACQPDSSNQGVPAATVVSETQKQEEPARQTPEERSELSVTFNVERVEPGLTVHISRDNDSFEIQTITRVNMSTGENHEIQIDGPDYFEQLHSQPGDLRPWNYKYVIQTTRGTLNKEFRVLKDLYLEGATSVSSLIFDSNRIELRKLVLDEGGVLLTEGRDLQIDAESFHSGIASSIQTFTIEESQKENDSNKFGQGGGRLILNFLNASGDLQVMMSGKKGSAGAKGSDAIQDRAAQGAKGADGQYHQGYPRGPDYAGERPSCLSNPTDGQRGADGLSGGNGFDGFQGGSSGSVFLTVKTARSLRYNISLTPGMGGQGGAGGKGQPGGLGGSAGASAPLCRKAKEGAEGRTGAEGKAGANGAEGTLGEFCQSVSDKGTTCVSRAEIRGVL